MLSPHAYIYALASFKVLPGCGTPPRQQPGKQQHMHAACQSPKTAASSTTPAAGVCCCCSQSCSGMTGSAFIRPNMLQRLPPPPRILCKVPAAAAADSAGTCCASRQDPVRAKSATARLYHGPNADAPSTIPAGAGGRCWGLLSSWRGPMQARSATAHSHAPNADAPSTTPAAGACCCCGGFCWGVLSILVGSQPLASTGVCRSSRPMAESSRSMPSCMDQNT